MSHILFQALGAALVKSGTLLKDQLIAELERFQEDLPPEVTANISLVIEKVEGWPVTSSVPSMELDNAEDEIDLDTIEPVR
jgi:hypothetical protein